MNFQPARTLPEYQKWEQGPLAIACREYHLQLIQMHDAVEQLRLDLRAAMAENRKLLMADKDDWK